MFCVRRVHALAHYPTHYPIPRTLVPLTTLNQRSYSHTPDSYSKDVDSSPASDSKIHRVDPTSENAQKPYEPPTGPWSKAGVQTKEYESMSKTEPYKAQGPGERYGSMPGKPPGGESRDEGPEGKAAEGRRPGPERPRNQ